MKRSISIILLIYFLVSLATVGLWGKARVNSITGDEPHYLVMAKGFVKYGSFEQTLPYKEEFKTREIYKGGLAPKDAEPGPNNTHAVIGPHGLFSSHDIGLPLVLAIPYLFGSYLGAKLVMIFGLPPVLAAPLLLGGVIGAKLFMIACSALVVLCVWVVSEFFSENKRHRFWVTIATAIALPLIPASNQIYPDLPAGLISLAGLYWFCTTEKKRPELAELGLASAIAFLPWLQIKFSATCVLLVLAIAFKIYFESKDRIRSLTILLIAGVSCFALASYNYYAFGKISGPYQSGALELSKTSFMVLLGLHFDQNQGFLFENPLNFIGIVGIGGLYRLNRPLTLLWGLVFLSLIVPNALHPAWYGGFSFSGRFGWAAAIVFLIPTIYILLRLADGQEIIFRAVIALSISLQLYFFLCYAILRAGLYNYPPITWSDAYSIYYFPIQTWLPMLYNSTWAFSYMPNYAWLSVVGALFIIGFFQAAKLRSILPYALAALGVLILSAGFCNNSSTNKMAFQASSLQSQVGRIVGFARIAEQGKDEPGFVNYGPYFPLRKGRYEVVLRFSSTSPNDQLIGAFDIFDATAGKQIYRDSLHGTGGARREMKITFETTNWMTHAFEFRDDWNGSGDMKIYEIILTEL